MANHPVRCWDSPTASRPFHTSSVGNSCDPPVVWVKKLTVCFPKLTIPQRTNCQGMTISALQMNSIVPPTVLHPMTVHPFRILSSITTPLLMLEVADFKSWEYVVTLEWQVRPALSYFLTKLGNLDLSEIFYWACKKAPSSTQPPRFKFQHVLCAAKALRIRTTYTACREGWRPIFRVSGVSVRLAAFE